MGYMDKNINMTLIVLIVGVVIIMLGVTVFFQLGLKERTSDFETTSTNLTQCETQLANYQDRLASVEEQVVSTSEDIRRYDQLYETKVAELGDAADDLESANKRVKNLELIKAGLESEKKTLNSQKNELQQEIDQLNDRIDDLRDDIRILDDDLDACLSGG